MKAGPGSKHLALSTSESCLLSACTQSEASARLAWEKWRAHHQIEEVDSKSQAMFGILYARLISALGGPETNLLKGIYKRSWYTNQLALTNMQSILDLLSVNDIPAVVMNDASLVGGLYPDMGYRAIRSIDLLVHAEQWVKSIDLASGDGWEAQQDRPLSAPPTCSVMPFSGPDRRILRIWANLFTAEPQEDTEARTWGNASKVQIKGRPVLALGPFKLLYGIRLF